jgi:hypothetical protein
MRPKVIAITLLVLAGLVYVFHQTADMSVPLEVIKGIQMREANGTHHMECIIKYKDVNANADFQYQSNCKGQIPSGGESVAMNCQPDNKNQRFDCKGTW